MSMLIICKFIRHLFTTGSFLCYYSVVCEDCYYGVWFMSVHILTLEIQISSKEIFLSSFFKVRILSSIKAASKCLYVAQISMK